MRNRKWLSVAARVVRKAHNTTAIGEVTIRTLRVDINAVSALSKKALMLLPASQSVYHSTARKVQCGRLRGCHLSGTTVDKGSELPHATRYIGSDAVLNAVSW